MVRRGVNLYFPLSMLWTFIFTKRNVWISYFAHLLSIFVQEMGKSTMESVELNVGPIDSMVNFQKRWTRDEQEMMCNSSLS